MYRCWRARWRESALRFHRTGTWLSSRRRIVARVRPQIPPDLWRTQIKTTTKITIFFIFFYKRFLGFFFCNLIEDEDWWRGWVWLPIFKYEDFLNLVEDKIEDLWKHKKISEKSELDQCLKWRDRRDLARSEFLEFNGVYCWKSMMRSWICCWVELVWLLRFNFVWTNEWTEIWYGMVVWTEIARMNGWRMEMVAHSIRLPNWFIFPVFFFFI